jgi:hypothetical protein
MLFHITAKHDYQTCPRKDPAKRDAATALNGVKVVGRWIDPPGHVFYAVIECDSVEAIREACSPLMDLGEVDVRAIRVAGPDNRKSKE